MPERSVAGGAPGAAIRAEHAADASTIAVVVEAAFGSPVEAELVEAIRGSPEYEADWSLVAEIDGEIVGHVMVSYASLVADANVEEHGRNDDGASQRRIAMLAPLAVTPDRQRMGIGSALVRAVVQLVDEAGEPCVILEGSPVYYRRFGFEPAEPLGIRIPIPAWAPPEAGQVTRLAAYDPTVRGTVVYPSAFEAVTGH